MTHFKTVFMTMAALTVVSMGQHEAAASQRAEVGFEPVYQYEDTTLEISGVGQLKYLGFIRIYNGALYLPPRLGSDRALDDVAKRLEVKYLRSFKAEDFGAATIAGLKKNVSAEAFQQLEPRIIFHNGLYQDISPGDQVSLTYIPGTGTRVEINGEVKGIVDGADFAAALFSLWLGDKPFDGAFKRALLGKR